MRLSVGFVSLGCPKNLVDTERMIQLLSARGVGVTGDQKKADIVVINTCGFLETAKDESLSTIAEFVKLKEKKKLRGVVVAGCMTERYLGLMKEKYPGVDAFIRVNEFSKITDVVDEISKGDSLGLERRRLLLGESPELNGYSELPDVELRSPGARSYAYVKIAEGCNRVCSFCIIPKLRGKLHSRSVAGVLEEVKQLASFGTKEIILIAQDLTSYGRERSDGASLLKLLEAIESVEGIEWVRLHYNYPRFFNDELISFLASSHKFARYLDIPFQHIAANVLKKMKRPESPDEIRELIEKLRARIPGVSIRTTLMVGFPGETDEDFEELLKFVEWAKFENMGAFKYCREEGTPSFDFEAQVSDEQKTARFERLMGVQQRIQKALLKDKLRETLPVMIDSLVEKTKQALVYRGRHYGQSPEVDGLTYVVSDSELRIGDIIPVALQKLIGDYDLLGAPEEAFASSAIR